MKKLKTLGKVLNRAEQKDILGGNFPVPDPNNKTCVGTGTGGDITIGYSEACIGYSGDCTIDGYLAVCTGGGGFWYY
ncbi:hypothetical protein [Winogradskyella sp.]|uniref:hypothetical protein n=1 Tax=Winogradskyella sp. TaxID=1883156 RepID=UPI003BABC0FE